MNTKFQKTVFGIIVSNIFAITTICLTKYCIERDSGVQNVFIFSEFFLLPIMMGIICTWFWKGLNYRGWRLTLFTLCDVLICIAMCYFFMGEGVICLLIVSPLILTFVYAGIIIGRTLFKKNDQRLNVSVFAMLLVLFVADALSKHQYVNVVSDTITIKATPSKVWPNVVAFKPIKQKPEFWLFQIGLPSPMATTVTGNNKGAGRKCIFNNGYTFGEVISTYKPRKDLVFDIIDQPRDPEIMHHLDLLRGEFLLKDNGNGTTTLTGNSWYRLYVFPAWYYDLWTESIVRNVHTRVMEHIKELSEQQ